MGDIPWDCIDEGIKLALHALADYGVDTFSSCQGGAKHGYREPCILFRGSESEGLRAVWMLEGQGFRVWEVSRHWPGTPEAGWDPYWKVQLRTLEPFPPRSDWVRSAP